MNLKEFQILSRNTEKQYPTAKRLSHAGLGMVTEVGEFATQAKRVCIYEKSLSDVKEGKSLRDHLLEELGDLMFYNVIPFNALQLTASYPETSWMAQLMLQLEYPENIDDLTTEQGHNLLQEVTFQMAIEASRYLQNFDVAHGHAIPAVVALIGLVDDAARLLGSRSEEVMDANIAKLQGEKGRYGSAGDSDAAAEARADKNGLDARSS